MNFIYPQSLLASLNRKPAKQCWRLIFAILEFAFLLSIHLLAILRVSILTAGIEYLIEVMTLMMTV